MSALRERAGAEPLASGWGPPPARERSGKGSSRRGRRRSVEPAATAVDLRAFVARYQRLAELLSPLQWVADPLLWVVRWHNYAITLTVVTVLCCLMYNPDILSILLSILAVAGMFFGKHLGQMKSKKKPHEVNLIDEDQEVLLKEEKAQRRSHQVLEDYKHIIKTADTLMATLILFLEHLHDIILWKHPEVSLCVTVLLMVFTVVLTTLGLRTVLAFLPFITICSNRYFIDKTMLFWRRIWLEVYTKYMSSRKELFRPQAPAKELQHSNSEADERLGPTDGPTLHEQGSGVVASQIQNEDGGGAVVVMADPSPPPPPPTDESCTGNLVAASEPAKNSESESDEQLLGGAQPPTDSGTTGGETEGGGGARGGAALSESSGTGKGSSSKKEAKGFCFKCNASFAKLLKRKHDCNFCGQCFCGSCTVRVKKSLLGATSPMAQDELVRVCVDCRYQLEELMIKEALPGVPDEHS